MRDAVSSRSEAMMESFAIRWFVNSVIESIWSWVMASSFYVSASSKVQGCLSFLYAWCGVVASFVLWSWLSTFQILSLKLFKGICRFTKVIGRI